MKILKTFQDKLKLQSKCKWDITDHLMEAKQIIPNQMCPIDKDDNDDIIYTCIRNIDGVCIYVPSSNLAEFLEIQSIYNKQYNLINLSELKKHMVKRNVKDETYVKINPPASYIKYIDYIEIKGIQAYLVFTLTLNYNDDIYNNLVNYSKLENKF